MAERQHREAQICALAHDLVNEKELLALVKAAINFNCRDACTRQTIIGCKLLPDQGLP